MTKIKITEAQSKLLARLELMEANDYEIIIKKIVEKGLKNGIFEKGENGAIIFKGETHFSEEEEALSCISLNKFIHDLHSKGNICV